MHSDLELSLVLGFHLPQLPSFDRNQGPPSHPNTLPPRSLSLPHLKAEQDRWFPQCLVVEETYKYLSGKHSDWGMNHAQLGRTQRLSDTCNSDSSSDMMGS